MKDLSYSMNTELTRKSLSSEEEEILSLITSSNEILTVREISNILEIKEPLVIEILNRDDFYNLVCSHSLNNMRLAYHSKAIPRLIADLDSEHKFYDSYDRLTKAIGAVKEQDNSAMKLSLEVLLKREEKIISPKPVSSHSNSNTASASLNTVSPRSGNIFEIENNTKEVISHSNIEFEFEEEEE